MLTRKHSLRKWNCFTLQVFRVLVSAGVQFNFADSDYNLPKNWKKCLDKILPRTLFLSPAFFKEAKIHFAALRQTKPPHGCGVCYELEDAAWLNALPRPSRTEAERLWQWPGPGPLTFPREPPRLGPNANAPAVFIILWWPAQVIPGTFGTHSTQVWAICLNPFVDSLLLEKIQNTKTFFERGLSLSWSPPWCSPTFTSSCRSPFVGNFHSLDPGFAVSANSNCTLSQIRKPLSIKQTFSIASWSEIPPCPHCFTMWPLTGTKQGERKVETNGLGCAGLLLSLVALIYTNLKYLRREA